MRDIEINYSKYMRLQLLLEWFLYYVMGYVAFQEGRFCMRNKEGDGDAFLFNKMMKFQNIKVWERWVVACVIGVI